MPNLLSSLRVLRRYRAVTPAQTIADYLVTAVPIALPNEYAARVRERLAGQRFSDDSLLATNIAIAFFVPVIVYLADAVGTQSESVAVRRLSLVGANLAPLLAGEIGTGILIGITLGAIAFLLVWLTFATMALAVTVGTALLAASSVATGIGVYLPRLFAKFGYTRHWLRTDRNGHSGRDLALPDSLGPHTVIYSSLARVARWGSKLASWIPKYLSTIYGVGIQ